MRALILRVEGAALRPVAIAVVALFAVVVALDWSTGPEFGFSIFYLLPIVLGSIRFGRPGALLLSPLGAAVWAAVDRHSGPDVDGWITAWNAGVRLGFFLIVSFLVAELRRLIDNEIAIARTDALTGLLNRRGFEETAGRELARARRSAEPITFAYIDVDHFKAVNDTHGHDVGDQVLLAIGTACGDTLREVDLAARLGGDEFALCLPGTEASTAVGVVERVRDRAISALSRNLAVSFSIGVIGFAEAPESLDEALTTADHVMYEAKREGRDRIVVREMAPQGG